jgi:hypothetical protein
VGVAAPTASSCVVPSFDRRGVSHWQHAVAAAVPLSPPPEFVPAYWLTTRAIGDGNQEHAVYGALRERLADLSVRVAPRGRQSSARLQPTRRAYAPALQCSPAYWWQVASADVSGDVLYGLRG